MKVLIIVIIAILIAGFTYFAHRGDILGASICGILAAIGAVLAFIGPFIVETVEDIPEEENIGGIVDEEPIPPLPEHEHEIFVTQEENHILATCDDGGSYELASYCECGEELKREYITINALEHDYKKIVTQPSCEENGFTTYKCSRCNDSYIEDYVDALEHDFVDGICLRCRSVSPDYETLITSQAHEFVKTGNYDEAIKLVSDAMDKMDSESLYLLYENIQTMRKEAAKLADYTAEKVNFITYTGSIDGKEEEDVYSLTPLVSGNYRFDFSDMVNGFRVRLSICDSSGKEVNGSSGLENGWGLTSELEKGCDYTVKVKSSSDTGSYTLRIGQQKEAVDITAQTTIYDSVEYKQQRNEYIFIPPISGIYRFDFWDVVSDLQFGISIYDSLNYEVGRCSGISNKQGVAVRLSANEIYKVQIRQYNKLGSYRLTIGKQKPAQNITRQKSVTGKITYTNQEDIYIFTPSQSKEYIFSFQNMVNGFQIGLSVKDSLEYKVGGYNGIGNDGWAKMELKAGETYTVYVTQYTGSGDYVVNIS